MSRTGPDDEFLRACARAGVEAAERAALWRLYQEWPFAATGAARLAELLADHGHWRLFLLSRRGDGAAARRFESYWRQAARTFLGRGFTREQVEELAAMFFARVYERAPGFTWKTPFGVFLRTVLLNLARDEVRRLRKSRAREAAPDDAGREAAALDPPDPAPSPETVAIDRQRRGRLRRAFARLHPVDRQLLHQHVLERRPGRELAAELGISPETLHKRLQRARDRLRRLVEEDEVSGG